MQQLEGYIPELHTNIQCIRLFTRRNYMCITFIQNDTVFLLQNAKLDFYIVANSSHLNNEDKLTADLKRYVFHLRHFQVISAQGN